MPRKQTPIPAPFRSVYVAILLPVGVCVLCITCIRTRQCVCVLREFMYQGYNSFIHSGTRHLRRRNVTCTALIYTEECFTEELYCETR